MTTSESKDQFFCNKTNRFESIRITNRIESRIGMLYFPVQNRDCENLLFSIIMLRLLFRGWSWTGQVGPLWLVLLSSAFTHFFSHSVATSIAVAHPPAADSCELTCHSFGVCHKSTCRLLQGPTSFDRMHILHVSGLARSGSDLEVPVASM